jgi:hypothetical protein
MKQKAPNSGEVLSISTHAYGLRKLVSDFPFDASIEEGAGYVKEARVRRRGAARELHDPPHRHCAYVVDYSTRHGETPDQDFKASTIHADDLSV